MKTECKRVNVCLAWERFASRPQVNGASDNPEVCIGIPHTGFAPVEWAIALDALEKPSRYSTILMSGQPVDKARNLIAKKFLDMNCPWLFYLDTDVVLGRLQIVEGREEIVPDRTALMRMLKRNLPILTGIYYRRSDPPVPGIYKYFPDMKPAPGHKPIMQYPLDKLFPIDAAGAGCLLIHRSVFDKVPRPWFLFGDVDANEFSEDFYFMHKADRLAGIKTICDPTVQCFHLLLLKVSRQGIQTANM